MTETNYASVLLIDRDGKRILLIRKNRPPWQAGKLNMVGGHMEDMESPLDTAMREVFEETGIRLTPGLCMYCKYRFTSPTAKGVVYFFKAVCDIDSFENKTDELCEIISLDALPDDTVVHLRWLIPLGLNLTSGSLAEVYEQFDNPNEVQ